MKVGQARMAPRIFGIVVVCTLLMGSAPACGGAGESARGPETGEPRHDEGDADVAEQRREAASGDGDALTADATTSSESTTGDRQPTAASEPTPRSDTTSATGTQESGPAVGAVAPAPVYTAPTPLVTPQVLLLIGNLDEDLRSLARFREVLVRVRTEVALSRVATEPPRACSSGLRDELV